MSREHSTAQEVDAVTPDVQCGIEDVVVATGYAGLAESSVSADAPLADFLSVAYPWVSPAEFSFAGADTVVSEDPNHAEVVLVTYMREDNRAAAVFHVKNASWQLEQFRICESLANETRN